jgi:hypothetical protein
VVVVVEGEGEGEGECVSSESMPVPNRSHLLAGHAIFCSLAPHQPASSSAIADSLDHISHLLSSYVCSAAQRT